MFANTGDINPPYAKLTIMQSKSLKVKDFHHFHWIYYGIFHKQGFRVVGWYYLDNFILPQSPPSYPPQRGEEDVKAWAVPAENLSFPALKWSHFKKTAVFSRKVTVCGIIELYQWIVGEESTDITSFTIVMVSKNISASKNSCSG